MLFQNDYMFRRTAGSVPLPKSRQEIDDPVFTKMMNLMGPHQMLIDFANCIRVSPQRLDILSRCPSLNFLDVSYTKLSDANLLTISENCLNIKALNISGCKALETLPGLCDMFNLEVLSLRQCPKVSSENLMPILANLSLLRSLDMGQNDCITYIDKSILDGKLLRLEELVLDGSRIQIDTADAGESKASSGNHNMSIEGFVAVLHCFPVLSLLNISDTPLDTPAHRATISSHCRSELFVERDSRRLQFVQAVIDNDVPTVRRLLSSGAELDLKLGPWCSPLLYVNWKARCTSSVGMKKIQAPYFLCDHSKEELRPTVVHLAILYDSQEVLSNLIFTGANMGHALVCNVWCGEVLDFDDKILSDEDLNDEFRNKYEEETTKSIKGMMLNEQATAVRIKKAMSKCMIYNPLELVEFMFERNVHRLTNDMINQKTKNWKDVCKVKSQDLALIIGGKYTEVRDRQAQEANEEAQRLIEEEKRHQEQMEKYAADVAAKEKADREAAKAAKEEEMKGTEEYQERKKKEEEEQARLDNLARIEQEAADEEKAKVEAALYKAKQDVEGGEWESEENEWLEMKRKEREERERVEAEAIEQQLLEIARINRERERGDMTREGQLSMAEEVEFRKPIPYKKPGRTPLQLMGKTAIPFDWRQHGLVAKLQGEPFALRTKQTGLDRDIFVLGAQSFWMESNRYVLASRLKKEAQQAANIKQRAKEDRLFAERYSRSLRQRGLKHLMTYEEGPDLTAKKEAFAVSVEKAAARKYMLRGGDDDDDDDKRAVVEEEEEVDSDEERRAKEKEEMEEARLRAMEKKRDVTDTDSEDDESLATTLTSVREGDEDATIASARSGASKRSQAKGGAGKGGDDHDSKDGSGDKDYPIATDGGGGIV